MTGWVRGLAALALLSAHPGRGAEPGLAGYLAAHRAALPPAGAPAELPPGFLAANGPRLYLLGEVHGVAENNDADLTLLQTLQRTAGVRTYLAEISYAHAWYLNRYLEKGDEHLLDLVFAQLRGRTVDASREKRAFWQALRRWNSGLPKEGKVGIVGIDLERFPGITRAFLGEHSDPAAGPESADRRFGIEQARRNLRDRDRAATFRGPAFDQFRDRILFGNFLALAPRLPAGSIYGRVGFAHVTQHIYDDVQWLSFHLSRRPSPWSGRVIGIWPLYAHSRRLSIAHGVYGTIDCSDERIATDPFVQASAGDLTLFALAAAGSPLAHRLLVPSHAPGGVTTEYFQYVLLFKNAHPAEAVAAVTPVSAHSQ